MKNFSKVFFAAVVTICFCSPGAFAQTSTSNTQVSSQDIKSLSNPQWQKIVDDLQSESKAMVEENGKLNTEYNMLQEKLSGLQDSVAKLRVEIANQEADKKRLQQKKQSKAEAEDAARQNIQKQEKEVAALEARTNELNAELAELEKKNNTWEAQLSGLQVQKREIMLDMKLQEFANEESAGRDDDEIRALTKELVDAQARESELRKTLGTLTEQGRTLPSDMEKLKAENKTLSDQIAALQSQRKQKEIEINKLEEDNRRLAAGASQLPGDIVRQRKVLEEQVVKLEGQLEGLHQSVAEAKTVMDKKRQLMDEIMRLDSENQELRNRISSILEQPSAEPDTDTAQ